MPNFDPIFTLYIQMSLPLLIQTILNFYQWRVRVQMLHNEYVKMVQICDNDPCYFLPFDHELLLWGPDANFIRYTKNPYYCRKKLMGSFNGKEHTYSLPKRYHYSSGES